jgi:hypothetical protein
MPSSLRAPLVLFAILAPACTDRTEPHSDLGRQLALHLCQIQATCGCDEELLIPDCEARVEREFIATERKAIAAGLELDQACIPHAFEVIDDLAACDRLPDVPGSSCPVYTAHAEVGEACEIYDLLPWVTHCRAGLQCIQGICRDLANPHWLYEGEICSDTQADHATGWLGKCVEGLVCDSNETRTCIPSPYWPPVPTGGECTTLHCVDESYCRSQDPEEDPSEEFPGICTLRTPEGQPCIWLLECTTLCTDGVCETFPPSMCEALEMWWAREWL